MSCWGAFRITCRGWKKDYHPLHLCLYGSVSFRSLERTMISARNQFKGTVKSVKLGNVMAEVIVAVSNLEFVSMISRTSAEQLGLKVGDYVTVIVKASEVLLVN